MEILSSSTGQTKELAGKIAEALKGGDVLLLFGDLGSGKTTFVGYLVEALGIKAKVQSPTFVLHRKYHDPQARITTVNHIDLYRITARGDVEHLALQEFFEDKDAVTVIEWPQIGKEYMLDNRLEIEFEYVDENTRRIHVRDLR